MLYVVSVLYLYSNEDDLDRFWLLQDLNDYNRPAMIDDRQSDSSEELSASNLTSSTRYAKQPYDPNQGAFEGIMSIRDDPRKHGQRHFCSKTLET